MDLISDVFVWVTAYGAASTGWMIFAFMSTVVGSYFRMTTQTRMKGLVRRQKALIAEWGRVVADGIPVSMPEDDEEGEVSGEEAGDDDTEVTEAELVEPAPTPSGAR